MKKIMKLMLDLMLATAIVTLIYVNQIGIKIFMGNMLFHISYLIVMYILAFLFVNLYNAIYFVILGKLKKMKIASVNIYPLFIISSHIKFSVNLLNFVKVKNTYSIDCVNVDGISNFIEVKEKIEKEIQLISFFTLLFVSIVALLYKNIFFIVSFCIVCLNIIVKKYYETTNNYLKERNLLFLELVFSKNVKKEVFDYHLNYLIENINDNIQDAELLNNIILILFAFFNNEKILNKKMLRDLDQKVICVIRHYNNDLSVQSRDIIFDYFDNRVCLGLSTSEKEYVMNFLDFFIRFAWDVILPSIYRDRTKELIMYIENEKMEKYFRKKYDLYIVN